MTDDQPTGCNCLCAVSHKDVRGVCIGSHDTAIAFAWEGIRVEVAMCSPCAAATLARTDDNGSYEPGRMP